MSLLMLNILETDEDKTSCGLSATAELLVVFDVASNPNVNV